MPKVEFKTNLPVDVQLQFPQGRNVESQFGGEGQTMYTLTDGRRMYLPQYVGRKIAALNVGAGGWLRIIKSERSDGRRGFEWDVEPIDTKAGPVPTHVVSDPAAMAPITQATRIEPQRSASVSRVSTSGVQVDAFKLAKVLHNLRDHAKKNGLTLTPEDCRSIAIAAYIQNMQSGQVKQEDAA